MLKRSLALLIFVGALAIHASAQEERIIPIGKPVPEFVYKKDEGDREGTRYSLRDEFPGRIVLVYFWRAGARDSIAIYKELVALSQKYKDKGVQMISLSPDREERVKETLDAEQLANFEGQEAFFYGNAVLNIQTTLGVMSNPGVLLVDPLGNIAWRGHPDDRLAERLDQLIAKFPPPAADTKLQDNLAREIERLNDRGEFGRAYTLAKQLEQIGSGGPNGEKGRTWREKLEGSADGWLKQAIEAERASDFEKAARIVAQIAVRFAETDIGRQAENEIGRMNGNRKIKELIRSQTKNAQGELRNEKAQSLEDIGAYDAALEIYHDVAEDEKYEETAAADHAKSRIEAILKDPGIRKSVAEVRETAEARRWLELADRYAALELYDMAREQYEKLLEAHPKSHEAKLAKERMAKLPASKEVSSAKP